MRLLKTFLSLIALWKPAVTKQQAFMRMRDHAVASICAVGRHTVTNLVIWLGRDQENPSSDYRVYSEYKWNVEDLFNPLVKKCLEYCQNNYIVVGVDDTRIKKTGKKIPGTCWGPDRLGPKFQVNLIWSQRYLQYSCLLPLYNQFGVQARAIPIRFIHAPPLKRLRKRASAEEKAAYKIAQKTQNLSVTFQKETKKLRRDLDQLGASNSKLLIVADGSFCNRNCMNLKNSRTEILARARKNTSLCFPAKPGNRRKYDLGKFSPEQIKNDASIPWKKGRFFYGGEWREMRFKEVSNVLWQSGTKTTPLRAIVLAPLPYVKGGARNYREPAYLLTTDLEASIEFLIQSYLDRWQIEVNFREEKSILGVGQAQVRNEQSVNKLPAFVVACYAALLLSSIITYCDKSPDDVVERPYWRPLPERLTVRALVGIMRKSLLENPVEILKLGLTEPMIAAIFAKAA